MLVGYHRLTRMMLGCDTAQLPGGLHGVSNGADRSMSVSVWRRTRRGRTGRRREEAEAKDEMNVLVMDNNNIATGPSLWINCEEIVSLRSVDVERMEPGVGSHTRGVDRQFFTRAIVVPACQVLVLMCFWLRQYERAKSSLACMYSASRLINREIILTHIGLVCLTVLFE